MHIRKNLLAGLAGAVLINLAGFACRPFLPLSYISNNGSPTWSFLDLGPCLLDLAERLGQVPDEPVEHLVRVEGDSLEIDAREYTRVLMTHPRWGREPQSTRTRMLDEYLGLEAMARPARGADPDWVDAPVPEGMEEFHLYLKGVWQQRRTGRFPDAWIELLRLPPEQRRHRTTWVLYMQGSLHGRQQRWAAAAASYRALRRAAHEGFLDSQGLARASILREFLDHARVDKVHALAAAPRLTAWGFRLRDPALTTYAEEWICSPLLNGNDTENLPSVLPALEHPVAREVLGLVLARGKWKPEALVEAYFSGLKPQSLHCAEHIAFAALARGKPDLARKWLEFGRADSSLTQWLLAEFARRAGHWADAATHYRRWLELHQAAAAGPRALPEGDRARFNGLRPYQIEGGRQESESFLASPWGFDADAMVMWNPLSHGQARLASMLIHQRQFLQAMDGFLRAGSWIDAAHLADHAVALPDLIRYADGVTTPAVRKIMAASHRQEADFEWFDFADPYRHRRRGSGGHDKKSVPPEEAEQHLRARLVYLLGRRLAREGRWSEAMDRLPDGLHPLAQRIAAGQSRARDPKRSRDERALAGLEVARILRWHGMELTGTESLPDSKFTAGAYYYGAESRPDYARELPSCLDWRGFENFSVRAEGLSFQEHPPMKAVVSGPEEWPEGEESPEPRESRVAVPVLKTPQEFKAFKPVWRYHYRARAVGWAWEAARTAENVHLKTLALYAAGIYDRGLFGQVAEPFTREIGALPPANDLVRFMRVKPVLTNRVTPAVADLVKTDATPLVRLDQVPRVFLANPFP